MVLVRWWCHWSLSGDMMAGGPTKGGLLARPSHSTAGVATPNINSGIRFTYHGMVAETMTECMLADHYVL